MSNGIKVVGGALGTMTAIGLVTFIIVFPIAIVVKFVAWLLGMPL